MKAIVYTDYGSPDVLHLDEVAKPTPKDNEILVRVYASPVNYGDTAARNFKALTASTFNMPAFLLIPAKLSFGLRHPRVKILGNEFAGVVEGVGSVVTRFKAGDEVFGYRGPSFGAYAEYVCIREDGVVALKPVNLSYEEAATVPYGACTALGLLRRAPIQKGQKVLINGASGSIGSYALQLAKYDGAEVTGVCGTPRLDFVKSLGADHVIDYTREDFTHNGEIYDLIFDVLGRISFAHCKNSLSEHGRLMYASFKTKQLLQMLTTRGSKKVICAMTTATSGDLLQIKELVEAGKIKTVVDRCYPMEQAAEAHRYAESGQKKGPVIITLPH
ncbi:MAG TPA: NAD(P)-dependent alcohol dehydrogenase [Aggregatilineaceae bacterium]|nr:NAD(P)-dependent alcohol dehydrogenase [Aggregatilineaceae bacterium]